MTVGNQELGASSGSREPDPQAVPALSGFDPARDERPWPLCGYAPGFYTARCLKCCKMFEGDKRALECLDCAAVSAKALIEMFKIQAADLRRWRDNARQELDHLIAAAATFWGTGSQQHNLVRDVADAMFRDRDGGSAGDACGSTAKQHQPGPEQSEGDRQ